MLFREKPRTVHGKLLSSPYKSAWTNCKGFTSCKVCEVPVAMIFAMICMTRLRRHQMSWSRRSNDSVKESQRLVADATRPGRALRQIVDVFFGTLQGEWVAKPPRCGC